MSFISEIKQQREFQKERYTQKLHEYIKDTINKHIREYPYSNECCILYINYIPDMIKQFLITNELKIIHESDIAVTIELP
ncbi:MAG TPA: hypothetical protein VLG50_05730 [Candidatus Saccharimonadales bacterium]|nr:hypothetical protein [Candidatus Saccharimonadales bacterium]